MTTRTETAHVYEWVAADDATHTVRAAGEVEAAAHAWDAEYDRTGSLALADAAAGTVERAREARS